MQNADRKPDLQGFTLLELLVVLAIVAMSVGLAAPAMSRWIERSEARAWRSDLANHIRNLPLQAYAEARDLSVDATGLRQAVPGIPDSVELKLAVPLTYSSRGAAHGGELLIRQEGHDSVNWSIEPGTGEVRLRTAKGQGS